MAMELLPESIDAVAKSEIKLEQSTRTPKGAVHDKRKTSMQDLL